MKFPQISRSVLLASVLALTIAAYLQSFTHLFVLDDHDLLARVIAMLHSPLDAWKTGSAFQSYYRPVFLTTLYIDNLLFGDGATGYHVVNLCLHLLTVWAAFLLGERLFGNFRLAALAAFLFALHPTHTENVSWISGRTDVLAALFGLLSIVAFHDSLTHNRRWSAWLSGGLFLLAINAKEVAVVVPALCLLLVVLKRWNTEPVETMAPAGRLGKGGPKNKRHQPARKKAAGAPWIAFGLYAAGLIMFMIMRSVVSHNVAAEPAFTGTEQWLNALRCTAMYIWHAVVGGGYEYIIVGWRIADPQFNFALPFSDSDWIGIDATVVAAVVLLGLAIRGKRPVTVFGLTGFFLALVPALGFVPIQSIFAVRFLYLPSFFLIVAVIDLGRWVLAAAHRRALTVAATGMAVAVGIWWGIATYLQDANWRDDVTLMMSMKREASVSPAYYFTLGNGYRFRGEFMQAANNFNSAATMYPEYFDAIYNYGACFLVLGQTHPEYYAQAIDIFTHALSQFPGNVRLLLALGDAYLRSGDEIKARVNYSYAWGIERSPETRQRMRMMNLPVE